MIHKVIKKVKEPVIFGTIVVTIGVFVASVFSYILQFLLGRMLSISDYGTFNALLALYNIIAVPGTVLGTSLIKVTSELKAKENYDKLTSLFWNLSGFAFLFGLLVFLLVAASRLVIARYLNISEISIILVFGSALGISFLSIVPVSFLQGLLRFKAFAFANILGGLLRLIFPVIFVTLGYRVAGVFGGIALGVPITYLVNLFMLRKNFTDYERESLNPYYKKILAFSLPVLLVNAGMMLLNNLDIILVKRFFDEVTAGYYSGAVTVSKVLLFGAGTVGVVMFPQISTHFAKGEDYRKKFGMFFALQLGIVLVGVLVFSFFPHLITKLMFGERFLPSVEFIPLFAVFSGLYVLINFMIMFFLAIGQTKIFLLQIPAVVFQFLLINVFHTNLYQVIYIDLIVSGILLISIFLYYYLNVGFNYRPRLQAGKNN